MKRVLTRACIFSVVIFSWVSLVTGTSQLPTSVYDGYRGQCAQECPPHLADSAPKTLTSGDCGCLELTCTDTSDNKVYKYKVVKSESGLRTIDVSGVQYVIIKNDDCTCNVILRRTVCVTDNDLVIFYTLNNDGKLYTTTSEASGGVVLTPVDRRTVDYTVPAVEVQPQVYTVIHRTCRDTVPHQLGDSTDKLVVMDTRGVLQLLCTDYAAQQTYTYAVIEEAKTGLLTVIVDDRRYLVVVKEGSVVVAVRTMVISVFAEQVVVYTVNENLDLCLAYYNDRSCETTLVPVQQRTSSATPRTVSLPAAEYSMELVACKTPLPEQLSSTAVLTIAVDTNGEMVLRCVPAGSQQVFVYKLCFITVYEIVAIEVDCATYLVFVSESNVVSVTTAVRAKIGEEIVVLVANDEGGLCSVWYNDQGNVQPVPVNPEYGGGSTTTTRSLDTEGMTPQQYDAVKTQFGKYKFPERFSETTEKKITGGPDGSLELISTNPTTHEEHVDRLELWTGQGVYFVEVESCKFVVIVEKTVIIVRYVVIVNVEGHTSLYTVDKYKRLCAIKFDESLNSAVVTEVKRRSMGESCINSVTLDEKDYNKYVAICSKTVADQFADTTQKWITCDTETGQMVLVCKYKRAEFTYNIDCTNGLLTFLCKAKYYWLDVVDTTVLVRRAVVTTYQEQTIVLVAEQGNLWVVSYDSQEDVVFTKVNTRSVEGKNEKKKETSEGKTKQEKAEKRPLNDEKKVEKNKKTEKKANKKNKKENKPTEKKKETEKKKDKYKEEKKECDSKSSKESDENKKEKRNLDEKKKEQKKKKKENINKKEKKTTKIESKSDEGCDNKKKKTDEKKKKTEKETKKTDECKKTNKKDYEKKKVDDSKKKSVKCKEEEEKD